MKQKKDLIILGIDTSCDDTCIGILEIKNQKSKNKKLTLLSNIISSQVKLHAKYGGVYPALAKREHQKNLPLVLKKAIKKANISLKPKSIDFIGVTVGPGLEPCLWQGINFAKNLAKLLKTKIIPVNHIEAHFLANFLPKHSKTLQLCLSDSKNKFYDFKEIFPAICLVVSGGHTQLILMKNFKKYKIIGETRDDAAGECFDKTARILGLGYPGGPKIAAEAAKFSQINPHILINLPRPMIYQKNYDFSFSGLKTAVLYDFKKRPQKIRSSNEYKIAMAAEIQQAIIDVLIYKTIKAMNDFNTNSVILGGGVVANDNLRKQFKLTIKKQNKKIKLLIPPKKFCTDNGAMIAVTAGFYKNKTKSPQKIQANSNLKI